MAITEKSERGMGKRMKKALDFIRQCNGWHGYHPNRPTVRALRSLARRKLIELSEETEQFRKA